MQLHRLRKRLHVSYLFAAACLSFVFGVWLMQFLPVNGFAASAWLALGLVALVGGLAYQRIYIALPMIILGGVVLGLWHSAPFQSDRIRIEGLIGMTVAVKGTIGDDPKSGDGGRLNLKLDNVVINNNPIRGSLWASVEQPIEILKRSDQLLLSGIVNTGFSGYSASIREAKLIDYKQNSKYDWGLNLRDNFAFKVRSTMSEPEASLGLGFLVGQQNDLPIDLLTALQIVGLTHIIVASGYNLTVLVRFARKLFQKVSKYLSAVASAVMIFSFISITGWSPSMTRAGLVASISLAAWYYGRKIHPVVLLSIVAAITVMYKPSYVWGDLGWSLSFAAFMGILILAPYLRAYFFGDKKENWLIRIIIETSSAYLFTLPLIGLTMGKISLVAIFANLFVVPIVPIVMALTFAAGASALVSVTLGQIVGWFNQIIIHYIIWVSSYLSSFSWSSIEININSASFIIWYILIIILCVYLKKVTKIKLIDSNIVI